MKGCIEIFHLDKDLVRQLSDSPYRIDAKKAQKIKRMIKKGANIHFVCPDSEIDENFPNVPLDTPIRVGGAMYEICLPKRVQILREAGFQNVRIDKTISLSINPEL